MQAKQKGQFFHHFPSAGRCTALPRAGHQQRWCLLGKINAITTNVPPSSSFPWDFNVGWYGISLLSIWAVVLTLSPPQTRLYARLYLMQFNLEHEFPSLQHIVVHHQSTRFQKILLPKDRRATNLLLKNMLD